MTDTITLPKAEKRDELRAKIEASERRIAERSFADQAKEAAGAATDFAKQHPMAVVGGAVAVGLAIGLATKPGRRVARNAANSTVSAVNTATRETRQAGQVTAKKASRFGTMLSNAILAFGMKMIDDATSTARAGQDRFEDLGDSASAKARELRRDAGYFTSSAADKGRTLKRRTRRRAERAVRDITDRVTS